MRNQKRFSALLVLCAVVFSVPLMGADSCGQPPALTAVYNVHADHLGSDGLLTGDPASPQTDTDGVLIRTTFTPFGDVAAQLGTVPVGWPAHGFTDHEHDSASGLVYMRARYYDAELGRFLSPDPALNEEAGGSGRVITEPATLNAYAYTYNRPTVMIDPDGREGEGVVLDMREAIERRISVTETGIRRVVLPPQPPDLSGPVPRLPWRVIHERYERRTNLYEAIWKPTADVDDARVDNLEDSRRLLRYDQQVINNTRANTHLSSLDKARLTFQRTGSRFPLRALAIAGATIATGGAVLLAADSAYATIEAVRGFNDAADPILEEGLIRFAASEDWKRFQSNDAPFSIRALDFTFGTGFSTPWNIHSLNGGQRLGVPSYWFSGQMHQ